MEQSGKIDPTAARGMILPVDYKPDPRGRLSCRLTISHQEQGNSPTQVECTFSGHCEVLEQPWSRRSPIDTAQGWVTIPHIDKCWVDDPGIVIIENRTGMALIVKPTPDEAAAIAETVLEMTYDEGDNPRVHEIIRPGRFRMSEVPDCGLIRIRAAKGVAAVTVTVMPR